MTENLCPTKCDLSPSTSSSNPEKFDEFMNDFVDYVPLFEDKDEVGTELNQLIGDCFGRRRNPNQRRIDFRSHLSDPFLESCERTDSRFDQFQIESGHILGQVDERYICERCHKSRRFFCYSCLTLSPQLSERLPTVRLPTKIDIIKHSKEVDGKSTCPHAAVIAPNDVRIFIYPNLPNDWPDDPNRILLLFPSRNAPTVAQYLSRHFPLENNLANSTANDCGQFNLPTFPFDRVVFIDSTWRQTKSIMKDERMKRLPPVMIDSEQTLFWRYHKRRPIHFLSTIEAIYYFLRQLHTFMVDYLDRMGHTTTADVPIDVGTIPEPQPPSSTLSSHQCSDPECGICQLRARFPPYQGQYDNLLFFFRHTYQTIKSRYQL